MAQKTFERSVELPVDREQAFRWHAAPGALERLTPPFEPVRVLAREGQGIDVGARVELLTGRSPFLVRWIARHTVCEPPARFVDEQEVGPFARWRHEHRFEPNAAGGSVLTDHITYELPAGLLGGFFGGAYVRKKLARLFAWRHRTTVWDLLAHQRAARLGGGPKELRVLVSGASGLVGSALMPFLSTGGHHPVPLSRAGAEGPHWDPAKGTIDRAGLEGFDGVVHLAGESIAGSRWSERKRRAIRESRVAGTGLLARTLLALERPPKVLVCASAVGYFGDRGDEVLEESSPRGAGFLADVAEAWEDAARPVLDAGVRLVHLRLGMVLDPRGGALKEMLLPARLGAGGPLGSGRQWWSWIALDDVLDLVLEALWNDRLEGPIHAVAPEPVRQREFAAILGRVLARPAILPAPAPALRLALGDMADGLLLASTRAVPARLLAQKHPFRYPDLESALRHMLGR